MPDLVPLQQAAGEFGVNPASLYRYLKRGKLKRWRRELDQKTYIDRDELRQSARVPAGAAQAGGVRALALAAATIFAAILPPHRAQQGSTSRHRPPT